MNNPEHVLPKVGFAIWLLMAFLLFPNSPFAISYVYLLLLAAPLWLIPMVLQIQNIQTTLRILALLSAVILGIAFILPKGFWAGILALPWLLFVSYHAILNLIDLLQNPHIKVDQWLSRFAAFYLPVGAFWALIERVGIQFLGYEPVIVLLTAVHFHYAGFLLLTIGAFLVQNISGFIRYPLALGLIAGIPLVAIGITTSHFDLPVWIEISAVLIMTIAGFTLGTAHIVLAFKHSIHRASTLWLVGGLALMGGMVLAFLYGIRKFYPIEMINIPWMYAFHGTLNAIGFAFPAILGWTLYFANDSKDFLSIEF